MDKIKLFEILGSFSRREFKEFGKFIRSPFFNESEKLIKFYDILNSRFPHFEINNSIKNQCFNSLYPGENVSDKKFRDICYQMGKLAEDFLSQLEIRNLPLEFKRFSILQISRRHLDKHFESKFREIEEILNKMPFKDNYYFSQEYLLKREKRLYYENRKPLGKRYEYYREYGNEIDIFVRHFVVRILKYFIVLLRHEKEINYKFVSPTIDSVSEYIKLKNYDEYPVVVIFFNLLLIIRKLAGDELYYKTKELVNKHSDSLERSDLRIAIKELTHYAHEKIEIGDIGFINEYFSWVNEILRRNLFVDEQEGGFNSHFFINIVKTGLQMEEIEWIEKFISKYNKYLILSEKENVLLLCNAYVCLAKSEYSRAYLLTGKINPKDFYFQLFKKILLIKIEFESGNFDHVLEILKLLMQILDYDKAIPENILIKHKLFITYLKKIISAKSKKSLSELNWLKEEINSIPSIESKEWLLSKIPAKL